MNLSEEKIRSIIREELLKEQTVGAGTAAGNAALEAKILKQGRSQKGYGMTAQTFNNFLTGIKKGKTSARDQLIRTIKAFEGSQAQAGSTKSWTISRDDLVKDIKLFAKEFEQSAPATPSTSTPSSSTGNKTVKQIQTIVGSKPDGIWGPNTQRAWVTWVTSTLSSMGSNWSSNTPQIVKGWKSGSIVASSLAGKKFAPNASGNLAFLKYLQDESGSVAAGVKPDKVTTGREKKDSDMTGGETVVKVRRKGKVHIFTAKNARQKGGERGSGFLEMEIGGRTRKLKRLTLRYKEPSNVTLDNISQTSSIWLNGKKLRNDKKTGIKNFLKNLSQSQLDSMFSIETK